MTNQISPDAQYVLDAFLGDAENTGLQIDDLRGNLANGLRATASNLRLNPEDSSPIGALSSCQDQIFAIADELDPPEHELSLYINAIRQAAISAEPGQTISAVLRKLAEQGDPDTAIPLDPKTLKSIADGLDG